MKSVPFLFFLLFISFSAFSQTSQQQKTDSICALVKKYFNEKSADKLYQLTGQSFQKQLSPEQFQTISENNLFPLGEIKETLFKKNVNGISFYKADFNTVSFFLVMSLNPEGKLEAFSFQPYKEEASIKNYPVPSSNPLTTSLDKKVDSVAGSYIKKGGAIGLSIGILKDGKTYFYGYGETAKGNKTIPETGTIFEIGSISKTFTATLLAIAVGEGKVRLNDPVNKYLPDSIPSLQYNGRVITLKDLSNHTSAIPSLPSDFQSTITDPKDLYKNYSIEKLYAFLGHLKLTREPGKEYDYSNTAVGLLGTILQKIYHSSYEELIIKYICTPLGMNDTRILIRKNDSARFAKGYDENGEYNGPWNLPPSFVAAGGIRSTARDMLKYAGAEGDVNAMGKTGLVKAMQLTHDTTFSNGQSVIGLGWHYTQPGERKVLFHNGATGGYRSYLAINAEKKFAVIILSNCAIWTEKEGNELMKWLEKN
ncbi:serine hydrolase domain-containing protein [Flavitalea flava]